MNAGDVKNLIEKSRGAGCVWAALPYGEKIKRVKKAARLLAESRDQIVETIRRENGKLAVDALAAEVIPAMMTVSCYARLGRRFQKREKIRGKAESVVAALFGKSL